MGAGTLLFLFGLITTLLSAGLKVFVKNLFLKNIPDELLDDVATLKSLDISTAKRMVSERLSSAMVMISEVFLNQDERVEISLRCQESGAKSNLHLFCFRRVVHRGRSALS